LRISRSPEYRLYRERPLLHTPGESAAADFAFAEEYPRRDAFLAEQRRRNLYESLLDFFNAGMVVVLAARFGARPLLGFLDRQIALVRQKLDQAAEERRAARDRHAAAQKALDGVEAERRRLLEQAQARAAAEQAQIAEGTRQALALLEREQADRIGFEQLIARRAQIREAVEEAMRLVVERYETSRTAESEAVLVTRFVEQMEQFR
jgi:F0F1-type ATP synthase membrane subunit b/b'